MTGSSKKSSVCLYRIIFILATFLYFFTLPHYSHSADVSLEKELQKSLGQSRAILQQAQAKLNRGETIGDEIARLKAIAEDVRKFSVLLQEQFSVMEEKVSSLGSKAIERHRAMAERYRLSIEEYLTLVDGLPSGENISQFTTDDLRAMIKKLKTHVDKILGGKESIILGSIQSNEMRDIVSRLFKHKV